MDYQPFADKYRIEVQEQLQGLKRRELLDRLHQIVREHFNFDHFVVGVHVALGNRVYSTSHDSKTPGLAQRYHDLFTEKGLVLPTIQFAQRTTRVYFYPTSPPPHGLEGQFYAEMVKQGVQHAVMYSTMERQGPVLRLTMGRAQRRVTDHEIEESLFDARALMAVLRETLMPMLMADLPERCRPTLTPRELEVLKHSASGLNQNETAVKMGITANTVGVHRSQIRAKYAASTWEQAIFIATRLGHLPAIY